MSGRTIALVSLDKPISEMTDEDLAELVGEGVGQWREIAGREPTEAEAVAVATLALGARLVHGDPSPVLKRRATSNRFAPADERRRRAVIDIAPRSPQAERVRAAAQKMTKEGRVVVH